MYTNPPWFLISAWLIAYGHFWWAIPAVTIFGLMDTLDGDLARLQHKASNIGMVLDATSDRMKEVFLFTGVAYYLIHSDQPTNALWATLTLGLCLCVSYVKSKGETAIKDTKITPNEINRLFQDGLMRYEVRTTILLVGLITSQVVIALVGISVFAALTIWTRYQKIKSVLS